MIGFDKLKERFLKAISSNTLSHAHIIVGPDGIGKSAFAEYLAREILGIKGRDSVDIVRVRPEKTTVTVGQIRDVVVEASLKPYEGERKVIIIYEAHRMGREAQNAILKTIEEPNPGVYFFLLTDNEMFLFETVKSRCHMHRLLPLNERDMKKYVESFVHSYNKSEEDRFREESLKKEIEKSRKKVEPQRTLKVSKESIDEVVSLSRGIPGISENIILKGMREDSLDLSVNILKGLVEARRSRGADYFRVLKYLEAVSASELPDFIDDFAYAVDCILKEKSLSENPIKDKILMEDISFLARETTYSTLQRYLDILYGMRRYVMPGLNINKETVVSGLMLRLLEV
jgi:DNA polymerase-3 subunit delta'